MSNLKKNIMLSIVIPAYNRAGFLETATLNLINQIKTSRLDDLVEIIISNDAPKNENLNSIDYRKNSIFIDHIETKYSFVFGFNQLKNLGAQGNIDFLLEKVRGKYILISGDDDLLTNGCIVYILKCIEEMKPNFILINTSNILSLDNINQKYEIITENRLNIHSDIFVENFERDRHLLESVHNWLYLTNLLPAVVFKMNIYELELANVRKYVRPENLYAWQGPVITGISKYGRFLVIAKCFVLHRKNESSLIYDPRGLFSVSLFDGVEICKIIKDYMPDEYKRYKKFFAFFIMKEFLSATKNGKNIKKYAWYAFCKHLDCFPENIQFFSMTLIPKFIANIVPILKSCKSFSKSLKKYKPF